jgi:hypothetical protein
MFVCASPAVYGQSPNMIRVWSLDSIKVSEISVDNKEIQINYDEVKDSIQKYIFDKIDIGYDKQCKIIRGKEEISTCVFTNDVFTVKYNDEILAYKYTFRSSISFKGEFPGIKVNGEKVKYLIQMRFTPDNK